MKKGLWIYLVVLILLAITIDCFILRTVTVTPDYTQSFQVGTGRQITVKGNTDSIVAITASLGYYRIKAGDTIVESEHITGDYFQKQAVLPLGKWVIEESVHGFVSFTVVSDSLVFITTKPLLSTIIVTIILSILITFIFFGLGCLVASD